MPKLIIWDLDGTLVNSLPATLDAFNDGLEPYLKRRLSPQEIMVHFGAGEDKILAKLVGERDAAESYATYLKAMAASLKEVVIFDGIAELLKELKSHGHTMGIFTGRGRDGTKTILDHHQMHAHFIDVITHDDCSQAKPHPEGIHRLCKKAQISERDTIMIGDSAMDILAARQAGATAIGCTWDKLADLKKLKDAQAHHLVAHPSELKLVLKNLLN